MEDTSRRGFLVGGLEAALTSALLKIDGKGLRDLTETDRVKLAQELNGHVTKLNAKVGVAIPNSNPGDPNVKKFDEYLENILSEYLLGVGHPLGYNPDTKKTYILDYQTRIWYVPVWVRNEMKEQGIQFTDYPDQKGGKPRTQEGVEELLKYY